MKVIKKVQALGVLALVASIGASSSSAADLCQGLITDKLPHPMTALAKPALGQVAIDPQFGTKIRRITAVAAGAGDDVIKPMYATVSAWNADESRLILYKVGSGHQLYNGTTYAFIRDVPFGTNEVENVYWHTTDPDILYYLTGRQIRQYRPSTNATSLLRDFATAPTSCSDDVTGGGDPMFMSWTNPLRIGLGCGNKVFIYEIPSNTILSQQTSSELPPQMAPSGTLGYRPLDNGAAQVVNTSMAQQRILDIVEPFEHGMCGRKANGNDTFVQIAFDEGPNGSGVGSLVSHDMTNGVATVVIGPATGYPYPPGDTHLSTLTLQDPGWVVVSISGGPSGAGVLQNELVLANTNTMQVCRVAHVRTFGKANTNLAQSYWAEAHAVPSPSGTRIAFGSDWGNGSSVDTYVVELPAFTPVTPSLAISDVTVTEGGSGTVTAAFTVTRTPSNAQSTSTVQYATADNTATAPSDYVAVALTTLTFTPGQNTKTVNVSVNGDITDEANESFFVNLSNPTGATLSDAQGVGTITDDDPNADLSITKTDGQTSASPGQVLTFTITAANAGPNNAPGSTVTDTLPAGLTGATWTCSGAGGGTCTPVGAGNISDTVDLPVGGSVVYTLTATVAANPTTVRNTVTVTVPAGFGDPNPANNSATDDDELICHDRVLTPDGARSAANLAAGASVKYLAGLRLGASYSVEVRNDNGLLPPTLTVFRGDDGCAATSTAVVRDTAAIAARPGPATARVSFTAAGVDPRYRLRILNGTAGDMTLALTLAETTSYSAAWSTSTTYDTYYSFQNTTNASVTGVLTLRDSTGAVAGTANLTIPAGRTVAANTLAMAALRNRTGTAQFTHDGPPSAILAQAAIANFTSTPAYVQPVKMGHLRQER